MVRRKATALDDGVRQFLADHPPSCARVNLKLALDELGEGAVWESLKWLRAESDAAPREARALTHGLAPADARPPVAVATADALFGPAAPGEPGGGERGGRDGKRRRKAERGFDERAVDLAGWQAISLKPLRALSLALGESLVEVCARVPSLGRAPRRRAEPFSRG